MPNVPLKMVSFGSLGLASPQRSTGVEGEEDRSDLQRVEKSTEMEKSGLAARASPRKDEKEFEYPLQQPVSFGTTNIAGPTLLAYDYADPLMQGAIRRVTFRVGIGPGLLTLRIALHAIDPVNEVCGAETLAHPYLEEIWDPRLGNLVCCMGNSGISHQTREKPRSRIFPGGSHEK